MGDAARPIKNWATSFAPGLVFLDAETAPANDTTTGDKPRELPARFRWIHCANEGTYNGHHQGAFEFTREVFEAFVRNFRASPQYKAGTIDLGGQQINAGIEPVIQFDYEHASEMPPWEGSLPEKGAPAPAWAIEVAIRNGADGKAQLWALADLGSTIRQQIADRQYRWVSIAFTLQAVHWITGKPIGPLLTSIAFTNHPFMIDLEPLAAANRVTSQPTRAAVRSPNDSPAPPGDATSPGGKMDNVLRERICRALKIQTLADDAAVGAAVEDAAGAGSKLQSLVTALGEVDYAAAMKVVPQLKEARDNAASLLDELNGLLGQASAADAAIAPQDVSAAMSAQGYKGSGAQKALLAHRQSLIDEEIEKLEKAKKPGERCKPAELVTACATGRQRFLSEHGVKDTNAVQLGTPLVAGPGGQQLQPPVAGQPLTIGDVPAGTVDLRGVDGKNVVEQMITHLRKSEPGFEKLPWVRQCARAGELLKTTPVITTQVA
jgi:hypothetical protein